MTCSRVPMLRTASCMTPITALGFQIVYSLPLSSSPYLMRPRLNLSFSRFDSYPWVALPAKFVIPSKVPHMLDRNLRPRQG